MVDRKHLEKRSFKEEFDATINQFGDKSQIEGKTNAINERSQGADILPSEFTEKGTDFSSDKPIDAKTDLERFAEIDRYAKVHYINEGKLRANEGMGKVAKLDKMADKKVK